MKTSKISFLCRLSERIHDTVLKADMIPKNEISELEIKTSLNKRIVIDFDIYPELKPVAEKILDIVKKSEESKQNEIKIEMIKELGNDEA